MGGKSMSAKDIEALADLPSRDVLLAMLAGAFQAPLVKTAGLLQALPRNFAYGLKALIDQKEAACASSVIHLASPTQFVHRHIRKEKTPWHSPRTTSSTPFPA